MSAVRSAVALAMLAAGLTVPAALTTTAAVAAAAPTGKLTPKALYQALLRAPAYGLPVGYTTQGVSPLALSPTAKSHHAIGEVAIGATKVGTAGARILYVVFPTHAAALADWKEGVSKFPKQRITPPPFAPKPSVMFDKSQNVRDSAGNPFTIGTTTVAFVSDNVIVEIDTSSTKSATRGDTLGALTLSQYALTHLAGLKPGSTKTKPPPPPPPPPPPAAGPVA